MKVEIIHKPFSLEIYGFSGTAVNQDYAGAGLKLMNRMWDIVKSRELKNKGINIWVYDEHDKIFAGVELLSPPDPDLKLEQKIVSLQKYAYYKHIGPYHQIGQSVRMMNGEIMASGLEMHFPYIEMYGHANQDESKQETELLMAIK